MFKKALLAAALLVVSSPAFVSAQDFFFSFDENSRVPTTTVTDSAIGSTGSLFIFADAGLGFNQLDLDFRNDNAAVVSFTGGIYVASIVNRRTTKKACPSGGPAQEYTA